MTQPSVNASPVALRWSDAFKDPKAFAGLLAEDVVLEASAIREPAEGKDAVLAIMRAGSGLYGRIAFDAPAIAGNKTFSEWRAVSADGETSYEGVTVITADASGAIIHVAIHHRPLDALLQFSARIGDALDGTLPRSLFWADPGAA